ncbi:TspO/MBR family protein [Pengzhenrongella phosphoraccumulans]|uniref:TspO/MBR family protein n=1 Tax=Pengzhenrongella phosphoraccumulans TaxID=3114394 RepID=UPI003890958D
MVDLGVRASTLVAAGVAVTVVAYAGLATRWVSSDPGWYAGLVKPSWQPPDWVFGVAWPYNFIALVVAGLAIALTTPPATSLPWLGLLVASSVGALTWAYLFYVPHRLTAAAIALTVAAVLAWALVVVAWRAVPWAGYVLTPYALWLTVATSLAVGFAATA